MLNLWAFQVDNNEDDEVTKIETHKMLNAVTEKLPMYASLSAYGEKRSVR
jgi:hypothetical protein